ncbi:hypothetical protein ABZ078_09670 [Streptomyces sp. NPDC006385]
MGELWQVALCVGVLAALAYQAIEPRGQDDRCEARRRWSAMLVEPAP